MWGRWSEGPPSYQALGYKDWRPQALALRRSQLGWGGRHIEPSF